MGRLIFSLLLLVVAIFPTVGQQYINFDIPTTIQLEANVAEQAAIEIPHTMLVDSIQKKQSRLMGLITTIAAHKELIKLTLDNAKGFGAESGVYKGIITKVASISKRSVSATAALMKTNFTGKAIAAFKISELVTETGHLCNVFHNIVTNGTVPNPLKLPGSNDDKDKINLLNRHERMRLALEINEELRKIDLTLLMLEYYCKHSTFDNLLMHIDRTSWVNYHAARVSSASLIRQWNQIAN